MSTILFSGRFDPVHCSHLISIQRLAEKYDKVIVVVLDHDTQEYPVEYRRCMLAEALQRSKGNYEVLVNTTHFAEMTLEEWKKYGADVYGAGNLDVLKHMEELGVKIEYVPRAYEDHAEYARNYKRIKDVIR